LKITWAGSTWPPFDDFALPRFLHPGLLNPAAPDRSHTRSVRLWSGRYRIKFINQPD
jgi:hypothetical protein